VNFPEELPQKLCQLGLRLLDQHAARTLVPALGEASGYWFGGGNLVQEPSGDLLLCGRYRNPGDARKGTDAGERGLEFSIFRATNPEGPFEKIHSFSKADLSTEDASVVSIEGGSLLLSVDGDSWEMFVSTEKQIPYPKNLIHFQKPGTGVWSIDCLSGDSSEPTSISTENSATVLSTSEGGFLHMKDPVAQAGTSPVYALPNGSRCRKWGFSRVCLLCLYTSMTGQSACGPLTKTRRRLADPGVTPARNSADSLGDLTMSFQSYVAYRKIFLYSSHLMQPVVVATPRRASLPMEP
jgi:hypothetical protein